MVKSFPFAEPFDLPLINPCKFERFSSNRHKAASKAGKGHVRNVQVESSDSGQGQMMDSPSAGWIKQVSNLKYLIQSALQIDQRGGARPTRGLERTFILVKSERFNLRKPLGLDRSESFTQREKNT